MMLLSPAPAAKSQLLSLPPELLSMCVEAALSDGSAQLLGTCRQLRNTAAELLAASPDLRLCTAAGRQLHRSPDCAWRLYDHGGRMARLLITPPVPGGNGNPGVAASAELAALGALDAAVRGGGSGSLRDEDDAALAEAQPGGLQQQPQQGQQQPEGPQQQQRQQQQQQQGPEAGAEALSSERRAALALLGRLIAGAMRAGHAGAISALTTLAPRCGLAGREGVAPDGLLAEALKARHSEATVAALVAAGATLAAVPVPVLMGLCAERRWGLLMVVLRAGGNPVREPLWRGSYLRSVCASVAAALGEGSAGDAAAATTPAAASEGAGDRPQAVLGTILERCHIGDAARSAALFTAFKSNQVQVAKLLLAHGAKPGFDFDDYLQRKAEFSCPMGPGPVADPSVLDSEGWATRLGLAVQRGLWTVAHVMLRLGAKLGNVERSDEDKRWRRLKAGVRETLMGALVAERWDVMQAVLEGCGGVALRRGDVEATLAAVQTRRKRKRRVGLDAIENLLRAWLATAGEHGMSSGTTRQLHTMVVVGALLIAVNVR